jgi:hypothetical protein
MALSPYDQSVYDAGYKYIPQSQYLLNPYAIPQGTENEVPSGIPAVYQSTPMGANTMGGALQAGNINYGDFAKAGFDAYANRQPSPLVDDLYQSKLDKSFLGFPSYQQQELTGPDMGEYIGSDTDIPLELTRAGQIQKSLQGFGQGIQSLGQKIGGFGPISMVLGSMDKFDTLPALDKQFIEQSMGYRGPTVFGENTTGGYVDPFGVNVRSAFGNYAEKVRDEFGSLGESLSGRLSDKYGATFNTETGMFESEDEEAARKANQMTNLMRKKFVFRQQQIKQQEFDKKIAEQQAAAAAAEAQAQAARDNAGTQRRSDGSGGGNLTRSRDQGGLGLSASQAQSVSAANAAAGMGGWGLADGGRVPYMDGGITDMLVDIYD